MSPLKSQEWILDAIDHIRKRKARPDLERICHMVERKHGLSFEEIESDIGKLVNTGIVIKLDYKGSTSYRNAAKCIRWNSSGTTSNSKDMTLKILHAIRTLTKAGAEVSTETGRLEVRKSALPTEDTGEGGGEPGGEVTARADESPGGEIGGEAESGGEPGGDRETRCEVRGDVDNKNDVTDEKVCNGEVSDGGQQEDNGVSVKQIEAWFMAQDEKVKDLNLHLMLDREVDAGRLERLGDKYVVICDYTSDSPSSTPSTPSKQPQTPSKQPQTPSKQPQTHSKQPQTPSKQPQTPSKQPQTPNKQPQTPSKQLQTPSKQPQTPSKQPQTSSKQPQTSSKQPQTPSKQPQTPSKQPQTPSKQPQTPSKQLQIPSKQPQTSSKQPQMETPNKQPQTPSKQTPSKQTPSKHPRTPSREPEIPSKQSQNQPHDGSQEHGQACRDLEKHVVKQENTSDSLKSCFNQIGNNEKPADVEMMDTSSTDVAATGSRVKTESQVKTDLQINTESQIKTESQVKTEVTTPTTPPPQSQLPCQQGNSVVNHHSNLTPQKSSGSDNHVKRMGTPKKQNNKSPVLDTGLSATPTKKNHKANKRQVKKKLKRSSQGGDGEAGGQKRQKKEERSPSSATAAAAEEGASSEAPVGQMPAILDGQPRCDFCLDTAANNRQGKPEDLLVCKDCQAKAHPSCMDYSDDLARRARTSPWQCMFCKTCYICDDSGDPDAMLFCDACDKGYHMGCHQPKIQEKPTGKWVCSKCADELGLDDDTEIESVDEAEMTPLEPEENSHDPTDYVADGGLPTPRESPVQFKPDNDSPESTSRSSACSSQQSRSSVIAPIPKLATTMKLEVPDASCWTIEDVVVFFTGMGFVEQAEVFRDQEIDGKSLLLMKRNDVLQGLSLRLGPALKIYAHVQRLQTKGQILL